MRNLLLSFVGLIACGSMACVAPTGDEADAEEEVVTEQPSELRIDDSKLTYFLVTRRDTRRCAYPTCGGWFVRRVNRPTTRCADGTWQAECHVASLDLNAIGLLPEDTDKFISAFGQGTGVVRGYIEPVDQKIGRVNTLVASEAWAGQAGATPRGGFYTVTGSGIRCFAPPCPAYKESKLHVAQQRNIAEVDLTKTGANEQQISLAHEELWMSGLLVVGGHTLVTGPAGTMPALVASEFYRRVLPSTLGQACGGITGLHCSPGEVCDVDIPGACGGADLSGVCKTAPDVCTGQFEPVCGCDGVTYSNDCERLAAQVQLAGRGSCGAP